MISENPVDVREGSILGAFVDLADSLVSDYDPLDFLYRLLHHGIPLTGAAAGAVLLSYEGRLHLVASSSEVSEDIELLELQSKQGPAHDAFRSGESVRFATFDAAAGRWPQFVRQARENGWTSAFAVPLRLREHVAGALVVFWSDPSERHPTVSDTRLLRALADTGTIAVLQRQATADAERINEQLHTALESRIKIEQAKGMIANSMGVGTGEAFRLLRDHARSSGRRLHDVAAAVTSGEFDVAALAQRS